MPPSTASPRVSTSRLPPASPSPLPSTKPPRPEAGRPYRSACALCKRGKTRCTWGAGPVSDGCVPCLRKKLSCPGIPAPVSKPKTRRAAPIQPVPPSTALVHLGPSSTTARIGATQVVALLAMDLLSSFAEHQNYQPAGITVDDIRRSVLGVHGRLEELRGPMKVMAFGALASGARSSSHPALIGPGLSTPLILDLPDAEVQDLSRYGALREGPCLDLVRRATEACDSELHPRKGIHDLQALLMLSYLPIGDTMSFSDPYIEASVSIFRQLVADTDQTPSERLMLFQLGQDLVRRDTTHALYSLKKPLFTNVEVQRLIPLLPMSSSTFVFEFDYVSFIDDTTAVFPDVPFFESPFEHLKNARLYMSRNLSTLLAEAPRNPDEEQQKAVALRQFWNTLHQNQAASLAALSIPSTLYTTALATGLSETAKRLAWLIIIINSTYLTFSLMQMLPQTVLQRWCDEGWVSSTLLGESTRETRSVVRAVARDSHSYLLIEHMKTTLHSLEFMRLEACPDWISIALERLEDTPEEEVTLSELERLAIGLRLVGWVYGRAVVRLRELEVGIVAIREQEFREKASPDFAIEDYLDFSSL